MLVAWGVTVVLLLLFVAEKCSSLPVKPNRTKVLILGAGLAGITAAKTLLDNNITDFLVLEGHNYTGGRIHSVPFAGLNIEAGANWIHWINDEKTAPVMKLREARKMNYVRCNYSDIVVR